MSKTQPGSPSLEHRLVAAYSAQSDGYDRLERTVERLIAALQVGSTGESEIQQLTAVLNEIACIEKRIAAANRERQSNDAATASSLNAWIERITRSLHRLKERTAVAEQLAIVSLHGTAQLLDSSIHSQAMVEAYARQGR